jgi:hypothetical protein
LADIRKQKIRNPILIEEKTQKGKVKGKINTHPSQAWNGAIVDPSHIIIGIQYLIEDGIPPDKRDHEVTDEKRTEKDNDIGPQPKTSNRFVLTNTDTNYKF